MVIATTSQFKDQSHYSLAKKLLPWAIYSIFPIALFRLCFLSLNFPLSPLDQSRITITKTTSSISSPSSSTQENESRSSSTCDYTNGKWVQDKQGPIYNGTTCGTIKEGQNCIAHGRSDLGYLYWRWRPNDCQVSRFDPKTFLSIITNKHMAFVGDSFARNQLESLLCMLATISTPNLVYNHGEENKFGRWNFPSHNATISIYWSPFLVQGVEKSSNGPSLNKLYLDKVDEKWAKDMHKMDFVLLSIGHWFLHPAVYYEGDSVLGCHYCPVLNHTEIGFYDALRKAIRTTLKALKRSKRINVVLTTFSPSHFEGDWDKAGACSKLRPYEEGEKKMEGMDEEIRAIEVEEVEFCKGNDTGERYLGFKVEALDVTKLSLMRPDGHPGPYMNPFPFGNGVTNNNSTNQRVQNDCIHWCLPGPIDTWNEILLQVMKKWYIGQSKSGE